MSFVATAVKQERLEQLIAAHAPLVIAYSGGVDSTYLLAIAAKTVGDRCLGVIADSPSLPREALSNAVALTRDIGAKLEIIETREMDNPSYAANPPNRCYFCKAELFATLESLAGARGFAAIAYGENADDARQVRPGRRAASEFRVLAPLKEVGLRKSEIRLLSRAINLPTADAPAQPCLSSRIPYGTAVTPGALAMIERAEMIVRGFGFVSFALGMSRRVMVARPGSKFDLKRCPSWPRWKRRFSSACAKSVTKMRGSTRAVTARPSARSNSPKCYLVATHL